MADGYVVVASVYELEGASPVAEFGVCYHFLNDVPAIAAATNPQSILLPPTVEVLPGLKQTRAAEATRPHPAPYAVLCVCEGPLMSGLGILPD